MRISIVVFFTILFVTSTTTVKAIDTTTQFNTDLHSTYVVTASSEAKVRSTFTITNTTSTSFVSKYAIEIHAGNIDDVKVTMDDTELPATVTNADMLTTVGLEFPEKVVGKDKQQTFTLEYSHPEVAMIFGKSVEINIPSLTVADQFESYKVSLQVPISFGELTISSPPATNILRDGELTRIEYDQSADQGITAFFGNKQSYTFQMSYLLSNPTGNKGIVQVVLPPDTLHQRIAFSLLNPIPQNIESDADGNWIATYILDSQQTQEIQAEGSVEVYLQPRTDFVQIAPTLEHVKEQQYWEKNNASLQEFRKNIPAPRDIFNAVTKHLEYNYRRQASDPQRTGAVFAYDNPTNAIAQDYIDLFIALARANNIASRQVSGYAISNSQQLRPVGQGATPLHIWAEFFNHDTKSWQPIDPTWSDTIGYTQYFDHFDFNHITLATQGESSTKPNPPILSSQQGVEQKSFMIQASESVNETPLDLEIQVTSGLSSFLGIQSTYEVTISNNTGQAWYNVPVTLSTSQHLQSSITAKTIDRLLPYQSFSFPVSLTSSSLVDSQAGTLVVKIHDLETTHAVQAKSVVDLLKSQPVIATGLIAFPLLLGILLIVFFWLNKRK